MHITVIVSKDTHKSRADDEPFVGQQYVESHDNTGRTLSRCVIRYERFRLSQVIPALRYRRDCRRKARKDDRLMVRLTLVPLGSVSVAMPVPEKVGR